MSKDPGFIFYPGDYLRDTQNLSEKAQVAYDRIMCEHMRNICITQKQHKFFTKRLNEDEIEELNMVLTKVNGGYQIEWVALSINKRKAYSESRRKNREGKSKEDIINTSETYVPHMENENEDEIEVKDKSKKDWVIPAWKEFMDYAKEKKPNVDPVALKLKYESWILNGWKDGNGKEIKNWKSKITATLPYIKELPKATGRVIKSEAAPEGYGEISATAMSREEYKNSLKKGE